jgi:hypothetical protein
VAVAALMAVAALLLVAAVVALLLVVVAAVGLLQWWPWQYLCTCNVSGSPVVSVARQKASNDCMQNVSERYLISV